MPDGVLLAYYEIVLSDLRNQKESEQFKEVPTSLLIGTISIEDYKLNSENNVTLVSECYFALGWTELREQ